MREASLQDLRALLTRVRRRWMTTASMRAGARAALGACAIILAAIAADALLKPADLPMLLMVGGTLLAVVTFAAWVLWPLRQAPTDRQVARFVEEHCPELEDRVASATEFSAQDEATVFHDLVLTDAAAKARGVDVDRVVTRREVRRSIQRGAVAGAALLITVLLGVEPMSRAIHAAWLYAFPNLVEIEVLPGDVKVISGQPLRIQARLRGVVGAPGRTLPQLTFGSGAERRSVDMRPAGGGFQFELPSVTASFTYSVAAAKATSREYTVTALVPPHVAQIDVEYDYPEFTGLVPRVETDGGDIFAPAGTRVTLRVHANKPVQAGTLVMADGVRLALEPQADAELHIAFEVLKDGSYRVALFDRDGLSNSGDTEYFIRAIDDSPPDVRILRPAGDRDVTSLEEVTIEARADDDYGLDRFELVYSVPSGPEQAVAFRGPGGAAVISGTHTLFIEELDVSPGDFVAYYVRARDVSRGSQSTESRSDIFFLEVRPFEEEFTIADQSMMGMTGMTANLRELAAAQKEIIIVTWKLGGMAASQQVHEDINAVARAQGELKEAAATVIERLRRIGRRSARRGGRSPDTEAMSKAVEAMARAQASLENTDTADALPHEMEALNQLLKAEAEVRRTQVSRQQNGGGGGAFNRAREDLSALFDRELRRQQETNYENRARAEQGGDTSESEALQKVRELAKRQEALNREQQDLARRQGELSEAELKRRLERLTREQSELREQAEELRHQLAQPQSQGLEPQSGSDSMGDVADEMRGATSELRRQDPSSASARSGRALQRLRDLERQLRGAEPDERRQAVGELQLEAQQLVDAQRRIASQAQHLQPGEGGEPMRRRMADEKEGLADRVDRLEHALTEISEEDAAEERAAVDEAAEELAREEVGRRMRESAEDLRSALGAAPAATDDEPDDETGRQEVARLAATEEELAAVLDRVARRLWFAGAQRSARTRQLSEELERVRELRDRLAEVEREIETAVGGSQSLSPDADPTAAQESGEGGMQRADAQARQSLDDQQDSRGAEAGRAGIEGGIPNLQGKFIQELREVPELLDRLRRENPSLDRRLADTDEHWFSRSAPGTEAFKQDFARWEELRRDVMLALELFETSRSVELSEQETRDRLNAGPDARMPEEYRRLVEKYYQSLAEQQPH